MNAGAGEENGLSVGDRAWRGCRYLGRHYGGRHPVFFRPGFIPTVFASGWLHQPIGKRPVKARLELRCRAQEHGVVVVRSIKQD